MTLKEKVICEAYTGICFCTGEDRNELYKYLAEKMGRPVYSHEFATNFEKIRDISREDFVKVCKGDYSEPQKETVRHGEWITTTKHKWRTDKNGEIDESAWGHEYHNGPVCEICGFSPCIHCCPGYDEDEDCYKHFICSVCGRHEEEKHPYCHCGAKMDGGSKNETESQHE